MLHIVKYYVSMPGFGAQNKAKTVFKTLFLNPKVIYFFHFDNVAALESVECRDVECRGVEMYRCRDVEM